MTQFLLGHQAHHTLAADSPALRAKRSGHHAAATPTWVLAELGVNHRHERQVLTLAVRNAALAVVVVAARRDPELAAHELHFEAAFGVLRGNEVELHLSCCAKNAAAFFANSSCFFVSS